MKLLKGEKLIFVSLLHILVLSSSRANECMSQKDHWKLYIVLVLNHLEDIEAIFVVDLRQVSSENST